MNDIPTGKWDKKLGNLCNLNTQHNKMNIETNNFSTLIKNFTYLALNKEETQIMI